MNVLVAEDDPVSRRFLEKILQNLGHEVTSCPNGAEAFNAFVQSSYSVVISDWMMPEMDGLELCKRIRRANKLSYAYFIMETAKSNKADVLEAIEAGVDDYLTKPLNIDDIRERLKAAERNVELHRTTGQPSIQSALTFKNTA